MSEDLEPHFLNLLQRCNIHSVGVKTAPYLERSFDMAFSQKNSKIKSEFQTTVVMIHRVLLVLHGATTRIEVLKLAKRLFPNVPLCCFYPTVVFWSNLSFSIKWNKPQCIKHLIGYRERQESQFLKRKNRNPVTQESDIF